MRKIGAILLVVLFTFLAGVVAAGPRTVEGEALPQLQGTLSADNETYVNANRILMFVTNHGNFGRDLSGVFGLDAGTFFPFSSIEDIESGINDNFVLYAAGLWIGGKVNGETRVTVAEYGDEYVPGPMANGTYQPDNADFRVYKLYSDSLGGNGNNDYWNWPVGQGAPVDGLGRPAMLGEQMLWTVFNDADPGAHWNDAGSTSPLGVEVQQTVWAADASWATDSVVISDSAEVSHTGPGDGTVEITLVDPSAVTPDQYMVVFDEDPILGPVWSVINVTTGVTEVSGQTNQSGEGEYPVVDGLRVKVIAPVGAAVDSIIEVANGFGPLDPPDNVMYSVNSTNDWYVSSDQGSDFSRMNWRGLLGEGSWEFRFTADGSEHYDWMTDELFLERAPFELWNVGVNTPDDPSDDQRLNITIIDDDGSGGWSWGDRVYAIETPYVEPAPELAVYSWPDDFRIGRIVFNDFSGALPAPQEGTVVRFIAHERTQNSPADTFYFSAPSFTVIPAGGESNAVYIKYKLYNKGQNAIEDCYLTLWADPDVGGAGDDLVGCDTLDNIFFSYNADNDDTQYGGLPPAMGFKVLAGPVVPAPGETADFDGAELSDYRNLPMTAFAKYINNWDPDNATESYNYMQGLLADGSPYTYDGQPLKYIHSGDPVTGTGDVDFNPADRRMMASFGPFAFAPGDSQYVLLKFAAAQGDDRLQSVAELKEILNIPPDFGPELRTAAEPDTLYLITLRQIGPVPAARVLLGYAEGAAPEANIDFSSVSLTGLPPADSTEVLTSYPGFQGEVYAYWFQPEALLPDYVGLFDTRPHWFQVAGNLIGGEPFESDGVIMIRCHTSGDADLNGRINVADITYIVNYLYRGGPAPEYLQAADADGSGRINVADITALVAYLFR